MVVVFVDPLLTLRTTQFESCVLIEYQEKNRNSSAFR